ncbi:MAG: membrane protein insertase YidC [Lactobacillales bacterium]|jgi:YidC/Oxa1 family membrane protein insertase|nr:membrane protein insertase YidC [Lactobacillales bacterium]
MKNLKRILFGTSMLSLLLFLSGCVKLNKQGQPTGEGIVYNVLVRPMGNLINYLVHNFGWNYGWAIIFITIIVRLIIFPLGVYQSKKAMVQQEKMQFLKPILDPIQARMKNATSREEQMAAQMDMQKAYKDNGVSMMGGIGCLPLIIQMPIFSALFYAAKFTKGIDGATFLGIDLGSKSLILVALAGVAYFLQSWVSMIGMPPEQKKQMQTMSIISPLMIVFMSFSSPAGVTLYWVVGGVFSCIQTLYTNVFLKPKIKKQIEEDFKMNPPKAPILAAKDVTPATEATPKKAAATQPKFPKNTNKKGRNVGKQHHK